MESNDLLECALQVLARIAIPPEKVREIIGEGKKKHINAYNLCDGKTTLSDIARKAHLNQGNLSRTTTRWVEQGILFAIGEGPAKRFLHMYPLTTAPRARRARQ